MQTPFNILTMSVALQWYQLTEKQPTVAKVYGNIQWRCETF